MDRLYPRTMASPRVHVRLLHNCCHLHPSMEQPHGPQIFRLLCVEKRVLSRQLCSSYCLQILQVQRILDKRRHLRP